MTTPASGAGVLQSVPFFGVRDIEASLKFYVEGLGFSRTKSWEPDGRLRWCWLQNGGAALMLQEYVKDGHAGGVPEGVRGLGVSVCFPCTDALQIYRDAIARGLAPRKPFVGNGLWVTAFVDPDGYRIEFDSPTDAPEESEYAG